MMITASEVRIALVVIILIGVLHLLVERTMSFDQAQFHRQMGAIESQQTHLILDGNQASKVNEEVRRRQYLYALRRLDDLEKTVRGRR